MKYFILTIFIIDSILTTHIKMPVQTRSMTKAVMSLSVKKERNVKSKPKAPKVSPPKVSLPKLRVTFMTQEEYNEAGYINSRDGGRIDSRLVAACIPAIKNSLEDDIVFEKYTDEYVKDKPYVVAPDGYYWRLLKVPYAGYFYDLEKI